MQTFIAQARRTGDCITITIPKEALAAEQILPDTFIKVTIEKVKGQNPASQQKDCSLGPDDPWRLLE